MFFDKLISFANGILYIIVCLLLIGDGCLAFSPDCLYLDFFIWFFVLWVCFSASVFLVFEMEYRDEYYF